MIIIAIVISIFFIVVIAIICRSYSKDIFELENRILQLEKRINEVEKKNNECITIFNKVIKRTNYLEWVHIPDMDQILRFLDKYSKPSKEVDDMACGRRGRPKGSHNTTHGGRKK